MSLNVAELRQQLGKEVETFRALQKECDERGGETAEDSEKFAKMEKTISGLEKRIHNEEFIEQREAEVGKEVLARSESNGHQNGTVARADKWDGVIYGQPGQHRVLDDREIERRKVLAVQAWLMWDKPQLHEMITDEHRRACQYFRFDMTHKEIALPIGKNYRSIQNQYYREHRAMSLTTTEGGYTIAEGFSNALEVSLLAFGGMRQVATVRRTSTGADLPWPTMNDVTNKGAILNEATTIGLLEYLKALNST